MTKATTQESGLAKLFYDQCVGSYSGHMASIPNNPIMASIFSAAGFGDASYRGTQEQHFAQILHSFASALEALPSPEDIPF